jgi:hypothetical protein
MAFSVGFVAGSVPDLNLNVAATRGRIELGSFHEDFVSSLMYWDAHDYERHWKQAIERIVESSDISCLITSIVDPTVASHLFWWPMYRVRETVYVQHHILFFNKLSSPFDENEPFCSVPRRKVVDENGDQLSEWSVSVTDIETFLQGIKQPASTVF